MQKWEYEFISLSISGSGAHDALVQKFNEMGQVGWDVIDIEMSGGFFMAFLKRDAVLWASEKGSV